jgi:hypothetical protein
MEVACASRWCCTITTIMFKKKYPRNHVSLDVKSYENVEIHLVDDTIKHRVVSKS